jgi:hypothetical protein
MGRVAPHENNEVRLVLGGFKPLATIEKDKDPIGYALAIALSGTGSLAKHIVKSTDCPSGEVVITKPINAHLIVLYMELLANGVKQYGIKEYHRRMGRLFGYTEDDINTFIEADIHCECSKCRGK